MGDVNIGGFSGVVDRELSRDSEINRKVLASRFAWKQETLYGYHRQNRGGGPSFDALVAAFQHMSPAMQDDLLVTLTNAVPSIRFYRADGKPVANVAAATFELSQKAMELIPLAAGRTTILPGDKEAVREQLLELRRLTDELLTSAK